ncbi:DNA-binding transcriptional regulator, LysR family [Kushneria avicenniae]|uniref:DNA-binding transcriptional regulator, LysR family n=1 Tax=Kushneria avicenniae TaxID=402385 RepID=A0A1I1G6V2_9GAMM|nr:LysR family transcriptional regulator [Kushneria avicenniae]SFC07275.1 DNA-binding transcriptional regulator, LysR family [Kushneria avicenniae]
MSISHSLDGLIEFTTTVQLGSFTAAAQQLGMTGSAVGKSVSRLEKRLGTKLFHRTTRRLTLTNEGNEYFDTAARALGALEDIEQTLATRREAPAGTVRLELPGAFGRRHVLPLLNELSRRFDQLDFSVMFSERTADIVAEGIDLAVRIGRLDDDADIVASRLGTQRLVICASPDWLDRHGRPETPEALMTYDCIVGWKRHDQPSWLLRHGDGHLVSQRVHARHEFSDGEAMVSAVLAGAGLCQLPTWLIAEELATGQLDTVLDDYAGAEMPIHVLWPTNRYLRPGVRTVIEALKKAARDNREFGM